MYCYTSIVVVYCSQEDSVKFWQHIAIIPSIGLLFIPDTLYSLFGMTTVPNHACMCHLPGLCLSTAGATGAKGASTVDWDILKVIFLRADFTRSKSSVDDIVAVHLWMKPRRLEFCSPAVRRNLASIVVVTRMSAVLLCTATSYVSISIAVYVQYSLEMQLQKATSLWNACRPKRAVGSCSLHQYI